MLSKKMAVSLTSLIIICALVFVVPTAMAQFDVTLSRSQPAIYAVGSTTDMLYENDTAVAVNVMLAAAQPIPLLSFTAVAGTVAGPLVAAAGAAATDNIVVHAFDTDGVPIDYRAVGGTLTINVIDDPTYAMRSATMRRLIVTATAGGTAGVAPPGNPAGMPDLGSLVLQVNALTSTNLTLDAPGNASEAQYHTITFMREAAANADRPMVVSIQRLREGSQTVVAAFQEQVVAQGAFNVRIVFTEMPNDFGLGHINVTNGTASNLVVGQPFAFEGGTAAADIARDTTAGRTVREAVAAGNPIPWQALRPHPIEGMYEHGGVDPAPGTYAALVGVPNGEQGYVPLPTGDDNMYHQYRVTITPDQITTGNFDLSVDIAQFDDGEAPYPNVYAPLDLAFKPNGREQLRLTIAAATAPDLRAGYRVSLPADVVIPAGGYLVITQDNAGSGIHIPMDPTEAPVRSERTAVEMLYNVVAAPTLPNLANAFLTGVVLDLESQHPGLIISEVMWGEDVSLNPSSNSQWIELYNPGAAYTTIADDPLTTTVNEALTLVFYGANEFGAVPPKTAAVAATATSAAVPAALPAGVTDRVGTLYGTGSYWSVTGIGQSGRSGTGETEATGGRVPFVNTVPIVSMYRVMTPDLTVGAAPGAMMESDGQLMASWKTSQGPKSANFEPTAIGVRHGTPGAETDATETPADVTAATTKETEDEAAAQALIDATGTTPTVGKIYISEIMFAKGGTLPQWIEISNGSRTDEVNLSDWTLKVDNAAADTDVVGSITFTIPAGTKIASSERHDPTGDNMPSTILVVTEAGRTNLTGAKASGQVLNLWASNQTELILAGISERRYKLLSDEAFQITLAPKAPTATKVAATATAAEKAAAKAADAQALLDHKRNTDMVGNLGADGTAAWALPMSDEGRSSIVRRHVPVAAGPASPEMGTEMKYWVLASDTSFAQPQHIKVSSYYGAMSDEGTPGFRPGGALPVELSHFRPARDKATGQVVITWSTQSELNNAGFFVKRSQQRNGEFKVINATMIAGAGTTSEKQFYTYTDTTAQPNVVYYYQIEDVSLDGNRQTLTRGIRLKGHVGAAGKATTLWGELKTSHE